MKFKVNRDKLLQPLQLACGVVERRQTAPILSNLLILAQNDRLVLTGSDEEVEITVTVEGVDVDSGGEITVPARKLMDICKSLPKAAYLTANLDGARVQVDSGRFSSHLATLPPAEFPSIQTSVSSVSVPLTALQLQQLLQRTSFAMAQQDVRYFFNGILFEINDGTVRLVATNGQRLATSYIETGQETGKHQFIVPRKAIGELGRLLVGVAGESTINLEFTPNHLIIEVPGINLVTKLIDATYPDYSRAIPDKGNKVMLADRQLLKGALSRTAILSNEIYRNVRLIMMPDKLDMHANNPQQEEAEESLGMSYEGETLEIGFNVSYLIEALSVMGGSQVRMTFSDANSACLLEDVDEMESLYVISPMML